MAKKYAIYNNTVKPPRIVNGVDQRKAIERVGHGVSFRDTTNNPMIVQPRQNPRIVESLTEGMIQAARGGLVRIEEIEDVVTQLKQHTLKAPVIEDPAPVETKPEARRALVSEMGAPADERSVAAEYPGAVNPDGEPNFRVTAPHGGNRNSSKHNRRSNRAQATEMFDTPNTQAPASEGEPSEV